MLALSAALALTASALSHVSLGGYLPPATQLLYASSSCAHADVTMMKMMMAVMMVEPLHGPPGSPRPGYLRMFTTNHQHLIVISRVVHDLCGPVGTTRHRQTQMPLARVRVVSWVSAQP